MKITRISIYKTHLPYVGGTYVWGAGNVTNTDAGDGFGLDGTPDYNSLGSRIAVYGESI
ncbi:MAG: hypothetical protein ACNYPF_00930 [Candidatus Puniceispirillales bacterium WSBS_2018_MAG_OTU23]